MEQTLDQFLARGQLDLMASAGLLALCIAFLIQTIGTTSRSRWLIFSSYCFVVALPCLAEAVIADVAATGTKVLPSSDMWPTTILSYVGSFSAYIGVLGVVWNISRWHGIIFTVLSLIAMGALFHTLASLP